MSMTTLGLYKEIFSDMAGEIDEVQLLVSRVRHGARRMEVIAERASIARVEMLDGLNQRATAKSISTLEALCDDVESRLERLRKIRRAG